MSKLLAKLGILAAIAAAESLGVWRAYTYSPETQSYAPLVLGLSIIAFLMAVSLLAGGRRRQS